MRKSRKNNPMIIDMIKGNVHIELILWPLLQVKLEVGNDVACDEINLLRLSEPFRALSESCYQYHAELTARGANLPGLGVLNKPEAITDLGQKFPVHELRAAGWTIPDFRRLEAA